MVSKLMKNIRACKFFSINNRHGIRRRHRHNFSIKKAAIAPSNVVLTRIGTTKGCFKVVLTRTAQPEPVTKIPQPPLPPSTSPEKRTVFLDLDETLVHSVAAPFPKRFDFVVRPVIRGKEMTFYVTKRPGVDEFLQKLAEKYEVVVFTAALREYATLVLDRLDRRRVMSHRLYRDSCRELDGRFVKDLYGLGRDLSRVVIVDDNPNSYALQPENAVPVRPFVDDVADRELWRLLEFFDGEEASRCEDIRDVVKQFVNDSGPIFSDDDDDENENGGELEIGDGKYSSADVPALTSIGTTSSRPGMQDNTRISFPWGETVGLECWVKTVSLGCLVLIFINVILCYRTDMPTF